MSNSNVFFILDNLRVGGIQRLVLDEAYSFAKLGIKSRIYLLEKSLEDDDMTNIDYGYFEQFNGRIEVVSSSITNFKFINLVRKDIKLYGPKLIVSHSAKGIVLSRVAQIFNLSRKKIKVIGFVHQLITLSDTKQKIKRLICFCLHMKCGHLPSNFDWKLSY